MEQLMPNTQNPLTASQFAQLPGVCQTACACVATNTSRPSARESFHRFWRFDKIWASHNIVAAQSYFLTCVPNHLRAPNSLDELAHFNMTRCMEELWKTNSLKQPEYDDQRIQQQQQQQHNPKASTKYPSNPRTLLFEFNPTVVALPQTLRQQVREIGGWTEAVYLASFRVSGDHNCVPWYGVKEYWNTQQWQAAKKHNFLGLALLDEHLQLLHKSDIVVDIAEQLIGPDTADKPSVSFIDFRLFVLHDRVYLNINGPPVLLVPIDLHWSEQAADAINNNPTVKGSEFSSAPPKPIRDWTPNEFFQNTNQSLLLSNKYDHSHQSTTVSRPRPIMQLVLQSTPSILEPPADDVLHGKNFALFPTADNDGIGVEYQIHPHIVRHVETQKPQYYARCEVMYQLTQRKNGCSQAPLNQPLQPAKRFFGSALRRRYWPFVSNWYVSNQTEASLSTSSSRQSSNEEGEYLPNGRVDVQKHPLVRPSFGTLDELWFRQPVFKIMSHGGACCVSWNDKQTGRSLWIGIAHRKVPKREWMDDPHLLGKRLQQPPEQYASFLYAFAAHPPYRMVAESGLFCLPFATREEAEKVNSYHRLLEWDHLRFMGQTFDCPRITFVSGITEHATDSNKAIISYGINDCTSRIMVVSKSDLARLLFEGMSLPFEREHVT